MSSTSEKTSVSVVQAVETVPPALVPARTSAVVPVGPAVTKRPARLEPAAIGRLARSAISRTPPAATETALPPPRVRAASTASRLPSATVTLPVPRAEALRARRVPAEIVVPPV